MIEAAPEEAVVEVYQCDLKGKGPRAKRNFAKGAFIIEYQGDLIQGSELRRGIMLYEQDKVSISSGLTS